MPSMKQEHKERIAKALADALPSDWKYRLEIRDANPALMATVSLIITEAPVDLIAQNKQATPRERKTGKITLNEYHLDQAYDGPLLDILQKARVALGAGHGRYISMSVGGVLAPFKTSEPQPANEQGRSASARSRVAPHQGLAL